MSVYVFSVNRRESREIVSLKWKFLQSELLEKENHYILQMNWMNKNALGLVILNRKQNEKSVISANVLFTTIGGKIPSTILGNLYSAKWTQSNVIKTSHS